MRARFRLAILLVLLWPAPLAAQERRVEIVDFGIYDYALERHVPAPEDIAGERAIISGVRLQREALEIDAQPGRIFGLQFRVLDPRLAGQKLTLKLTFPRLTNPRTGRSATLLASTVEALPGTLHLHAYGFDHAWEMAEGEWAFEVVHRGEVLARKAFKVILPMN